MQVRQGFGATNSERRYGMFSAPVSLILFLGFLICPPSLAQEVELKKPSIPTDKIEAEAAKKPAEIYEQDMAQAYKAFDEEDYPLAKQRYEVILKNYPDDTRAIIGLARTLHRMKRISGVEPSELREVMEKVKKTVDKFAGNSDEFRRAVEDSLNESPEMQKKKEALAKKLRTGGAVSLRRGGFADPACDDYYSRYQPSNPLVSGYLFRKDIASPFLIPILEFDWPSFL